MAAIGGVGYLTSGTGVPAYLLSRAAMSATSMALDPKLRRQWAVGDWPGALAASQAHLPLWGPIHSGFKAVGQGAYVQAGLQAGVLALDVAGLRYAGRQPGRLPAPSEPVPAAGVPFEVDNVLESAARNNRNGLTNAGRALQKHVGRAEDAAFKNIKFSHKTANQKAESIINKIMTSENRLVRPAQQGGYEVFDTVTGRGFAVSREGNFNGFRSLNKAEK